LDVSSRVYVTVTVASEVDVVWGVSVVKEVVLVVVVIVGYAG